MHGKYQLLAVVIALCGVAVAVPVQAAPSGALTGPTQPCSQTGIAPPGPEADPYLQHYQGTGNARYTSWYWCNVVLGGQNLAEVSVAPPGPEADLYLQHYQGTGSAAYTGLPVKLTASSWRLVDYQVVQADGSISRPFGTDAVGYLLVTPEHYAAVSIAPADKAQAAQSFISYLGKLNYQGDQSIHPLVSHDPTMVGVDQVNAWDLTQGKLTLTTPSTAAGSFGRLIWELVK